MGEKSPILKILNYLGVTQSELAAECSVNKGQLNAYLNNGASLAEEKQIELTHNLLERLDASRKSRSLPSDIETAIKKLQSYIPYQARYGKALPGTIVLPSHAKYLELGIDLLNETNARPFVLGISGGPKTGKTNLGRGVEYQLRKERVVFVDCLEYQQSQEYATNLGFVPWFVSTVENQWGKMFNEPPVAWDSSMLNWLNDEILDEAPCTFIFDHLEALQESYQPFSSGWHNILNQARRKKALEKIGLVLIFDEAAPDIYAAKTKGSRVEQRMRTITTQPFPKGAVKKLWLEDAHPVGIELPVLVDETWHLFQGHPYLTHCYINAYANSPSGKAKENALRAAQEGFQKGIAPKLLSNIYAGVIKSHFSTCADAPLEVPEQDFAMFLQDTLLFIETDHGMLHCTTPWIQQQFSEMVGNG